MSVLNVFDPLQNVTPRFTEEQLAQIIEWFDENAKPLLVVNEGAPINVISIENLIDFLKLKKFHRRSFHYPSYGEIMTEAEKLKAGITRLVTKAQLIYMLDKWVLETSLKHELLLAFMVFDTEKRGFLEIDEIALIVKNYGDFFDEAETQEMLRDANVKGDGNIFYKEFIDSMFSIAPELDDIRVDYLYKDPDADPSVEPEPIAEESTRELRLTPPPPPPPPPAKKKKK